MAVATLELREYNVVQFICLVAVSSGDCSKSPAASGTRGGWNSRSAISPLHSAKLLICLLSAYLTHLWSLISQPPVKRKRNTNEMSSLGPPSPPPAGKLGMKRKRKAPPRGCYLVPFRGPSWRGMIKWFLSRPLGQTGRQRPELKRCTHTEWPFNSNVSTVMTWLVITKWGKRYDTVAQMWPTAQHPELILLSSQYTRSIRL